MNAFCIEEKPHKYLTFRSIENVEKCPFPVAGVGGWLLCARYNNKKLNTR